MKKHCPNKCKNNKSGCCSKAQASSQGKCSKCEGEGCTPAATGSKKHPIKIVACECAAGQVWQTSKVQPKHKNMIVRTTTAIENALSRDKKLGVRIEVALGEKTSLKDALLAIVEEIGRLNREIKTQAKWGSIETRVTSYSAPRSKDIKSKHYLMVSGTRDFLPAEKEEMKKKEAKATEYFKKAALERAIAEVKKAGYTVTAKKG